MIKSDNRDRLNKAKEVFAEITPEYVTYVIDGVSRYDNEGNFMYDAFLYQAQFQTLSGDWNSVGPVEANLEIMTKDKTREIAERILTDINEYRNK